MLRDNFWLFAGKSYNKGLCACSRLNNIGHSQIRLIFTRHWDDAWQPLTHLGLSRIRSSSLFNFSNMTRIYLVLALLLSISATCYAQTFSDALYKGLPRVAGPAFLSDSILLYSVDGTFYQGSLDGSASQEYQGLSDSLMYWEALTTDDGLFYTLGIRFYTLCDVLEFTSPYPVFIDEDGTVVRYPSFFHSYSSREYNYGIESAFDVANDRTAWLVTKDSVRRVTQSERLSTYAQGPIDPQHDFVALSTTTAAGLNHLHEVYLMVVDSANLVTTKIDIASPIHELFEFDRDLYALSADSLFRITISNHAVRAFALPAGGGKAATYAGEGLLFVQTDSTLVRLDLVAGTFTQEEYYSELPGWQIKRAAARNSSTAVYAIHHMVDDPDVPTYSELKEFIQAALNWRELEAIGPNVDFDVVLGPRDPDQDDYDLLYSISVDNTSNALVSSVEVSSTNYYGWCGFYFDGGSGGNIPVGARGNLTPRSPYIYGTTYHHRDSVLVSIDFFLTQVNELPVVPEIKTAQYLVVGNKEVVAAPDVHISPNPANQYLQFYFAADRELKQALLLNLLGDVVVKEVLPKGANKHNIDTSTLPAGPYVLILQSDQTASVHQVVITH